MDEMQPHLDSPRDLGVDFILEGDYDCDGYVGGGDVLLHVLDYWLLVLFLQVPVEHLRANAVV